MSYFEDAYAKTREHEGGYANDPDDVGGETYKGISRVFNPSWDGWAIVDRYRSHSSFPDTLDFDKELQEKVRVFFKAKYFDTFRGDDMPKELAMEMFDTAVNLGEGRAVTYLQTALNCLNKNGKLWLDLVDDGDYGNATHTILQIALKKGCLKIIIKIINVLQGAHIYCVHEKVANTREVRLRLV